MQLFYQSLSEKDKRRYAALEAKKLGDGGGSNSAHFYIFMEKLQALVDQIGREIRIAHYPPYTSKYNPIEHPLVSPCHSGLQRFGFR